METSAGTPYPLGVRVEGNGINVAVSSEIADAVEVCVFGDGER